jgi:membrane protein DedA with SNARE-associated domain
MSEWALDAVPTYGPWLVALVTFLSCLAVPVPASILMLAAGGFSAVGDLVLWQVAAAALLGAIAGDQAGYWAARLGGAGLMERLSHSVTRTAVLTRARALVASHGVIAVFLTRWLLSPLGPYANLVTGAARFGWAPFTLAAAAGEAVWVGVYVGAGHSFAGNLSAATEFAGSILGFLAAGAVAAGLGWWLITLGRSDS